MVPITHFRMMPRAHCPGCYHRVRTCRFDIKAFDFKSNEDERGMLSTVSSVNQLISAEIDSGIDPGRIVVGGFSQGGAMSLLTTFTNERKLAGAVCLSGWAVLRDKLKGVGGLLCPWEPTLTLAQLAPDVLSARVVGANLLGTWHR